MKYILLLTVLFTSCIVEPIPTAEENISLLGTWCTKEKACYTFTSDSVSGGAAPYSYDIYNEHDGGYYIEGVIESELFKPSFGDIYFNVKRNVLVMYFGGVLFKFEKVGEG